MAWQLVYTSAPRLLQAGRTGFGTVAKHAAIRAGLQAEIERFSQFSRVAGLDDTRVIFYHRVVSVQGEKFHVVSRIRDAGSDYTGRTNHIAHHIVLTAREVMTLGKEGPTSADLIVSLTRSGQWLDRWDEPAREFSDEEEISIASVSREITLPAVFWAGRTGSARHAAVLAPGTTAESCWVVSDLTNGIDVVSLFGESLLLHPAPWQISFTTDIQPTDRVEELAWRGVSLNSPMAATAQQSVRPTLDLTNPATLPTVLVPAGDEAENGPVLVEAPIIEAAELPSLKVSVGLDPLVTAPQYVPTSLRPPAKASRTPSLTEVKLKHKVMRPQNNAFWPISIIAILVLGIGGYFGYQEYDERQRAEHSQLIIGNLNEIYAKIKSNPPSKSGFQTNVPTAQLKLSWDYLGKINKLLPSDPAEALTIVESSKTSLGNYSELSNVFNDLGKDIVSFNKIAEAKLKRENLKDLLNEGKIDQAAKNPDADTGYNDFLKAYNAVRDNSKNNFDDLVELANLWPKDLSPVFSEKLGEHLQNKAEASFNKTTPLDKDQQAKLTELKKIVSAQDFKTKQSVLSALQALSDSLTKNPILEKAEPSSIPKFDEFKITIFDSQPALIAAAEKPMQSKRFAFLNQANIATLSKVPITSEFQEDYFLSQNTKGVNPPLFVCFYEDTQPSPVEIYAIADKPFLIEVEADDLSANSKRIIISARLLSLLKRLQVPESALDFHVEMPTDIRKISLLPNPKVEGSEVSLAAFYDSLSKQQEAQAKPEDESATLEELEDKKTKSIATALPLLKLGSTLLSGKQSKDPKANNWDSFQNWLLTKYAASGKVGNNSDENIVQYLNELPAYLKDATNNAAEEFDLKSLVIPLANAWAEPDYGSIFTSANKSIDSAGQKIAQISGTKKENAELFFASAKTAVTKEILEAVSTLRQIKMRNSSTAKPKDEVNPDDIESAKNQLINGFPPVIIGRFNGKEIVRIRTTAKP